MTRDELAAAVDEVLAQLAPLKALRREAADTIMCAADAYTQTTGVSYYEAGRAAKTIELRKAGAIP